MNPLFYLLVVAGGICNTVQAGANAQLKKSLEAPILATTAVYATGLAGILLLLLFAPESKPTAQRFAQAPWWAWLGGALSIGSTIAGVTLSRKLGSAVFTSLSLTAALVTSVILDHLGWVGFDVHRLNSGRLIGCALLVGGIVLIAKY